MENNELNKFTKGFVSWSKEKRKKNQDDKRKDCKNQNSKPN